MNLIDKNAAAAIIGVHPESLLRAVREGRYTLLEVFPRPAYRTHRKFFFDRAAVEQFAARRRVGLA